MGTPIAAVDKTLNLWKGIWGCLRPVDAAKFVLTGFDGLDGTIPVEVQSFVKDSYPHNHTYIAAGDRLLPSRKLAMRVARLSRLYPAQVESLIDLSCSKGFFVFHAATQPGCRRALGVDLDESCLNACRLLNARFARQSLVNFARLSLSQLAEQLDNYGGPFQVALLVNTYQYLVFGSHVGPPISCDHRDIFRLLRQVCDGRLIFHNRLHVSDLQRETIQASHFVSHLYDPHAIFDAATEFFEVRRLDRWSRRPVWLLDARR